MQIKQECLYFNKLVFDEYLVFAYKEILRYLELC